jgi:hypothetical protein
VFEILTILKIYTRPEKLAYGKQLIQTHYAVVIYNKILLNKMDEIYVNITQISQLTTSNYIIKVSPCDISFSMEIIVPGKSIDYALSLMQLTLYVNVTFLSTTHFHANLIIFLFEN